MTKYNILVINPGSTSDEVSYFRGDTEVFHKTVRYSPEDLKPYENEKITAQFDLRKRMALEALKEHGVDIKELHAVIGRGGLAYDKIVAPEIKRRVGWIAQVLSYPGGDEMTALRRAAELGLRHPATVKQYGPAVQLQ